jgi:hypothetical protein
MNIAVLQTRVRPRLTKIHSKDGISDHLVRKETLFPLNCEASAMNGFTSDSHELRTGRYRSRTVALVQKVKFVARSLRAAVCTDALHSLTIGFDLRHA